MEIQRIPVEKINPAPYNPRKDLQPGDPEYEKLKRSIEEFGFVEPLVWNRRTGNLVGGHQRFKILLAQGVTEVECSVVDLDDASEKALNIALNKISGDWDLPKLKDLLEELDTGEFDIELTGFDIEEIEKLMTQFHVDEDEMGSENEPSSRSLSERFIIPPFSVLDTRQGYWQERKKAWLSLGIKSELGRGGSENRSNNHVNGVLMKSDSGNDPRYYFKKQQKEKELGRKLTRAEFQEKYYDGPDSYKSGTSIFDPVLCELVYRWFCPEGGTVVDPFAGGSVRGIVAAKLGRQYIGCELRPEQVQANRDQARDMDLDPHPVWVIGDSQQIDELIGKDVQADLIFSCPPYADLEVYSDDPRDLSTMDYEDFLRAYRTIIRKSVAMLRQDRFACFVVGDVRDKKGFYRNFVSDTIQAFIDAGMMLYNEAILVNAIGSLAIRVGRYFSISRKLGKTHQNVLIFYKGDPKKIKENFGEVEVELLEVGEEEE